jgi:excisionase family DNA binding protein
MEPLLLPIPNTCEVLGIGRSKVYQLINAGLLETVKIGRRRLVRVASIRAVADAAATNATGWGRVRSQ